MKINIIINIFLLIINCTWSILLFINYKNNKKIEKNNKEQEFNYNEYLNSLEFNTLLDNEIRKYLGKKSNDDIVKIVTDTLIANDKKSAMVGKDILSDYIRDMLLNYINKFDDTIDEITDKVLDNVEVIDDTKYVNLDDKLYTNLSNVLNDFYKDSQ